MSELTLPYDLGLRVIRVALLADEATQMPSQESFDALCSACEQVKDREILELRSLLAAENEKALAG